MDELQLSDLARDPFVQTGVLAVVVRSLPACCLRNIRRGARVPARLLPGVDRAALPLRHCSLRNRAEAARLMTHLPGCGQDHLVDQRRWVLTGFTRVS